MNGLQKKILTVGFISGLGVAIYGLSNSLASGSYGVTRLSGSTIFIIESLILGGTFFFYKLYGKEPKIKKHLSLAILVTFTPLILFLAALIGLQTYSNLTYKPSTDNFNPAGHGATPYIPSPTPDNNWFPRENLEIKKIEYQGIDQDAAYSYDGKYTHKIRLTVTNKTSDLNSHWPGFKIIVSSKQDGTVLDSLNESVTDDIPAGETKSIILYVHTALNIANFNQYATEIIFDGGSIR